MVINFDLFSGMGDALNTTKEVATGIAKIMGMIFDVLGFIGFRVFLLLIITALFLWFMNMISPLSKKTNYFMGVGVGVLIAVKANLAFQPFILKYLLIILFPFVVSYVFLYLIKFIKISARELASLFKCALFSIYKERASEKKTFSANAKKRYEKNKRRNKRINSLNISVLNRNFRLSPYSGASRFHKFVRF